MSIEHCKKCGRTVDTDFNAEHFDDEVQGCEVTYEEKLDDVQEDTTSMEEKLQVIAGVDFSKDLETLNKLII